MISAHRRVAVTSTNEFHLTSSVIRRGTVIGDGAEPPGGHGSATVPVVVQILFNSSASCCAVGRHLGPRRRHPSTEIVIKNWPVASARMHCRVVVPSVVVSAFSGDANSCAISCATRAPSISECDSPSRHSKLHTPRHSREVAPPMAARHCFSLSVEGTGGHPIRTHASYRRAHSGSRCACDV